MSAARPVDRGAVSAELALALAVIMLPLVVLVGSAISWPERHGLASAAAAEGARAAALAADPESARAAMVARVSEVVAGAGIDPGDVRADLTGVFATGEHITVSVTIDMPTLSVAGVGPFDIGSITRRSTERIEVHRVLG